jgi:tetratricopeptide (TPR) repeat protein
MSARFSPPAASSKASAGPIYSARSGKRGGRGAIAVFGLGCSLVAGSMVVWVAGAPNAFADGVETNPPVTLPNGAVSGSKSDPAPAAPKAAGAAAAVTPVVAVTPAAGQKAGEAYAKGKALIAAKDWATAIIQLEEADKAQPNNADTNNLLGFSNRKLGKLDVSLTYYKKALSIDAKHLGAHEYLGELYLMMKDPAKAKAELATLSTLCGVKCEQYLDLKKAIGAYKPVAGIKKK